MHRRGPRGVYNHSLFDAQPTFRPSAVRGLPGVVGISSLSYSLLGCPGGLDCGTRTEPRAPVSQTQTVTTTTRKRSVIGVRALGSHILCTAGEVRAAGLPPPPPLCCNHNNSRRPRRHLTRPSSPQADLPPHPPTPQPPRPPPSLLEAPSPSTSTPDFPQFLALARCHKIRILLVARAGHESVPGAVCIRFRDLQLTPPEEIIGAHIVVIEEGKDNMCGLTLQVLWMGGGGLGREHCVRGRTRRQYNTLGDTREDRRIHTGARPRNEGTWAITQNGRFWLRRRGSE